MSLPFTVVIPARYGSTRLHGKALLDIAGKPLIQYVYERGVRAGAEQVIVATDDERIRSVAEGFGARVRMTATTHASGTDRLAEVARQENFPDEAVIVNLQGDEPLMPLGLLRQVADNLFANEHASVATLCTKIEDSAEIFDPNAVKVVMDAHGYALYFSRAPIPWDREVFASQRRSLSTTVTHYRHIGLYAYRGEFLKTYTEWAPCALENAESLEQLRVLWHGRRIHVDKAIEPAPPGVDTPSDLEKVRALIR